MSFVSYSVIDPYYQYTEYSKYNVVPGIINLIFNSTPSANPADYKAVVEGGLLSAPLNLGFTQYDGSLAISGLTVSLRMPVVAEFNAYIQVYYQGQKLPFSIRCKEDYRYTKPAIFEGLAISL